MKEKIVEKKVGELKDYGAELKSLIGQYVPPDRDKIQAAFQAGNANITPEGGVTSLVFNNYYQQGDKMTFAFDSAAKKISSINVNTYLDDPKDVVTLAVNFASLPDGTNHVQRSVLDATGEKIEVTVTAEGRGRLHVRTRSGYVIAPERVKP